MPMSGTCRNAEPRARRLGEHGYTLLEIVVVLAILGLVTAMVVPSVVRGIESWRRQAVVDALADQLRGLPAQAREGGRDIIISNATLAAPTPPVQVEDDWSLSVAQPWRVRANGACGDGLLVLREATGRTVAIRVGAPFCDPVVDLDGGVSG